MSRTSTLAAAATLAALLCTSMHVSGAQASQKLITHELEKDYHETLHEHYQRRLQANMVPVDLQFSQSPYIYKGNFTFGSNKQLARMRFTSNSDWTLVTGQDCKKCVTRAFNVTRSTSATPGSYKLPENYVGSLKYAGSTVKDTVCVGNKGTPCVDQFEFFVIMNDTEQGSVLQRCDGIMGLAPDEDDNGPSYMTSLRNISLIDQLQISFQMTSMNKKKSTMTFGGYDPEALKPFPSDKNRTIYWYDNMHDDREWGTQLRNILIDGVSLLDNTTYAKIDSFMPFIQIPIPMYLTYVKYMQANHSQEMECSDQITGFGMCRSINKTCESIMGNFTNLTIRFNDSNAFTVPPSSYLRTETTGSGMSICYNMIIGSALAQNEVILGDTFMENYLIVYDF